MLQSRLYAHTLALTWTRGEHVSTAKMSFSAIWQMCGRCSRRSRFVRKLWLMNIAFIDIIGCCKFPIDWRHLILAISWTQQKIMKKYHQSKIHFINGLNNTDTFTGTRAHLDRDSVRLHRTTPNGRTSQQTPIAATYLAKVLGTST